MKKKLIALGTCALMAFGLTACGSSMSYDDYDLKEYIEVGEYKGLTVAPYSVSVTEDEIQAQIDSMLESAVESEELEKGDKIESGDTANIDYVGKKDGKKFDGGSAEGYDLEIGSGSFIDGFEDGLIGKAVGETVELDLTFPEDYSSEDLAGQDVVFTVTINSATRNVVPEYDLDFVKANTEYDSIDEFEEAVEKDIYNSKEDEEIYNQQTELWSQVLENTEVKKYPDREVDHYIEFNSNQMDDMAEAYGMTREELLASYEFDDEDEFAAVNEDSSKLRVKQEMVIEYIADTEKLEYTQEEKDKMIEDFEAAGYDDKTIETQTGRTMEDYVHIELLYQKVLDFLLENAEITGAPKAD